MTNNDSSGLVLRPFRRDDAHDVVAWFTGPDDAIAVAGTDAPWPYTAQDLVAASVVPGRIPLTVTSAADPAAVLGHVAVVPVTATAGRLARIVLAPQLRGRGVSGAVLALAEDRARTIGLTELALFVVPGNVPALRAYAAAGYQPGSPDPEHPSYVRLTRRLG
jgi:GNAT superfamily N-acetyltransferase